MILQQPIISENLVSMEGTSFYVYDKCGNNYRIKYDLHLPNGQRIHIVDGNLEDMFVWNDAIIVGDNQLQTDWY